MTTAILPTNTASITTRAMLVDLNIRIWSAHRTDEKVSREVAEQHNTTRDSGNYRKRLLEKDALSAIRKVAREAYLYHMNVTLPWLDNGARILPAELFFEYEQRMRDFDARLDRVVDDFVDGYPALVNTARRNLNGLFNSDDYPSVGEIRHRFGLSHTVMPLPDAGDFRVDLGDREVARVRRQIEQTMNDAMWNATRDTYSRILSVVGHMSERLRKYQVTADGVQNTFRDSLVENVRELVGLLPALNMTHDPALTSITDRMRDALLTYDGDTLRASAAARIQVANAADEILRSVQEFLS